MAVPPSLRVSVGVPPATVTASLRLSVSVTVLPASRSPLRCDAGPDATTDATVGVVVSICGPLWVRPDERQVGGIAGAVGDGRRIEIDRGGGEAGRVLAGADGIAEGQRTGAGAAGIGRGAAVVEGQRRGAAGHRHRLAQVERQASRSCRHRGRRSKATPPATIWSAPWCRSAGCPGSGRTATGWRHCRRRR